MAWKKLVLIGAWSVVILAGAGLFVFKSFAPSIREWTIAVTITAVLAETAFWITAAVLGVTIWEGRKRVFQYLTRPFRSN